MNVALYDAWITHPEHVGFPSSVKRLQGDERYCVIKSIIKHTRTEGNSGWYVLCNLNTGEEIRGMMVEKFAVIGP